MNIKAKNVLLSTDSVICQKLQIKHEMLILFFSCQNFDSVPFSNPNEKDTVSIFTCEDTFSETEWTEGYIPIEAEEGFEELLQSLDFSQLEDPVDISKALEKYHNEISYALEVRPHGFASPLYHEDALKAGKLGEVVLGSLLLGQDMEHQFDIDVELEDERLTTWEAKEIMSKKNNLTDKKTTSHALAAKIILDTWLNKK